MSHSPIVPLSPRPQVESGWLPPPRSSSFNRSEYRNIASPSPSHFFFSNFYGADVTSSWYVSFLAVNRTPFSRILLYRSILRPPTFYRFETLLKDFSIQFLLRSSLFSSSSFIFPLSRFEVWKEKKRGGREGEKKGGGIEEKSRKKRTVSFELERIFLLLQFFFSSQRIESTDVQVVLRTSFSSGEECICFTNIHFCFAK